MPIESVFAHPWDLSPTEAREFQGRLLSHVRIEPLDQPVRWVAGVDVGMKGDVGRAAVVVLSLSTLEPVEAAVAEEPLSFPYVPGLLAFREGPPVLAALEKLERRPDLLIFDAHGMAHPRRMGLATHLGILLDLPSVGCAKSRLCGEHGEPDSERGSWVLLTDDGETIGAVLRTRDDVRPVYVSIGHRVTLQDAIEMVLRCGTGYRLPETTRWAHRVAGGAPVPNGH